MAVVALVLIACTETLPGGLSRVARPIPSDGEVRALQTASGVVVPVLGRQGDGYLVRTPCNNETVVFGGMPLAGATVVIDAGHGGSETGAVGANGLTEAELNLAVAQLAQAELEAAGASVVLTRTADYRMALAPRAEIATSLEARAFVSIHHNGDADGPSARPGTETYFQIDSTESRRLSGLLYEEVVAALAVYEDVAWVADRDAGAKFRPNDEGGDYYGILRRSAGVPAALSEALFLSNPPEAELLERTEVRQSEAEAISRAVVRFLTSDDPGSGFVTPYPRTGPAGPGGGTTDCIDPPL
jgi:N-acetylmuramoyl-L-alanine amidase